jgi:hypothetical protein
MSYATLTEAQQRKFAKRLVMRRSAHVEWVREGYIDEWRDILIVGDQPGPRAPDNVEYHHTPFYSKLYSGGWLNEQLVLNDIAEDRLMWINSASKAGYPAPPDILKAKKWTAVIALGNNAYHWVHLHGMVEAIKVSHPQFHKRFKAAERYVLLDVLEGLTKVQVEAVG